MTLEGFFDLARRNETKALEHLRLHPALVHLVEVAGDYQGGQPAPALVQAAHRGLTRIVVAMLNSGADIQGRGLAGGTALHVAAWAGHCDTVAALVERGASLEVRCEEYGGTPLLWAAHGYGPDGCYPKRDQIGAARVLIEAGADPTIRNRWGNTPLDLVSGPGGNAMRALLEDAMRKRIHRPDGDTDSPPPATR